MSIEITPVQDVQQKEQRFLKRAGLGSVLLFAFALVAALGSSTARTDGLFVQRRTGWSILLKDGHSHHEDESGKDDYQR